MLKGYKLLKRDVKNAAVPIILLLIYYGVFRKVIGGTCLLVKLTGFPCPGCGLTRAGELLLRLQFQKAWEMHLFIYPIVLLCLTYILFRYVLGKPTKPLNYVLAVVLVAMVFYYIYRMICFFPGDPPISYNYDHILRFFKNY